MEQEKNNLFEIKISDTGVYYIRKLKKLVTIVFILVIVVCLFEFGIQLYKIIKQYPISGGYGLGFSIVSITSSCIYLASAVANVIAVYLYLKFSRAFSRSLDNHDQELFNYAFKYMYQNGIVSLVVVLLIVLLDVLYLIASFLLHL